MERIHEAPNNRKNPYEPLLEELDNLCLLSPWLCIYRVPEQLREGNEKAYTPQVVSIGPLHHGKEHLKAMEDHKKRYLRDFLSRTGVRFHHYIQIIKDQELRLGGFYADSIEFGSDEFVRIVLVDAAFVIDFLLRYYSENFRGEVDHVFNNPRMMWDVLPDLWLLDNQLPFFILQVGVKIRVGKGSSLFDIKFSGGILEIPKLRISDTTDVTLKNVLAFELCHHREENYVTNYVFLMEHLAKTPKDVELLVEYGIIDNWLGDTKKTSTLLLDFGTGVMVCNYYYAPLCADVNNYCRSRRHKWMANLRQNYLNSPWSIISVVAAAILLILAFIQTVCSIKSIA